MSEYSVISERVGLGGARKVSAVNESTTYTGWGWSRHEGVGRPRWQAALGGREAPRSRILCYYAYPIVQKYPRLDCRTREIDKAVRTIPHR